MTGRLDRAATRAQRAADRTASSAAVYPTVATLSTGGQIRLRIEALDAPPGTGSDLADSPLNSHVAYLPPRVSVPAGVTLTTDAGDVYLVVPPIQRDSLGDTLGLSWRGPQGSREPTPGNDPTPTTPPSTLPSVPGWWNEVDP